MTLAGLNETYYSPNPQKAKKILGIPCWLKKQLDPHTHDICTNDNSFVVNYNNPKFKENLQQFITAMGKHYNHNPDILRLDVGLVGTWGEWHLATHYNGTRPTLGHIGYTTAELIPYIDMMRKAFPDKMLSIDLGSPDDDFASYATKHGVGWRADCLGDWAKGWNHMQQGYPQTLHHTERKKRLMPRITSQINLRIRYSYLVGKGLQLILKFAIQWSSGLSSLLFIRNKKLNKHLQQHLNCMLHY
ncbi:hypothetical protein [Photobacterium kishitanii]|uniref:hypothetical protein n=1 Tax=Photobacterium kishitanii TaxID=318456 RepID=UPI00273A411E|nr:hypothetical protein [Photobacterium kishitanii]